MRRVSEAHLNGVTQTLCVPVIVEGADGATPSTTIRRYNDYTSMLHYVWAVGRRRYTINAIVRDTNMLLTHS